MRSRLGWKLLAVHVPILVGVVAVLWLAIDTLAASYFSTLMDDYGISPGDAHAMFLDAVHRYIAWTSVSAIALATLFSFLLTRTVLRPLARVTEATRRIADGDFEVRVAVEAGDEAGELAHAFNRMADELETIEQLRKRMVSDVAHELRSPLTNVRGYLEGLADGVVEPSREVFDMLRSEIVRLSRLVEDLLQLAKADAARARLERKPVPLDELVERVLALYRHVVESKGIRPNVRLGEDARVVAGDRDALFQALRNVVENACRHSSPDAEVEIRSRRVAQDVVLSVTNSGDVIPDADLPHVFERFYRVGPARAREDGGAGVGLAVVKELVEAHGGRVSVESGRGRTTFTLVLPALERTFGGARPRTVTES